MSKPNSCPSIIILDDIWQEERYKEEWEVLMRCLQFVGVQKFRLSYNILSLVFHIRNK